MNKNSTIYKVLLLGILCAVCGLLMSGANAITEPIIKEAKIAKVKVNLEKIYPGATFSQIETFDDPSGYVTGAYQAEGKGYIYEVHAVGYNSDGFDFMIGFDNDGKVSGYLVLSENETSGFGKRAFEQEYSDQILSMTASDEAPLLSGATLTTTAVRNGIKAAATLFESMK